jgi:hypothetical protein
MKVAREEIPFSNAQIHRNLCLCCCSLDELGCELTFAVSFKETCPGITSKLPFFLFYAHTMKLKFRVIKNYPPRINVDLKVLPHG